jgi:hypothetical protein
MGDINKKYCDCCGLADYSMPYALTIEDANTATRTIFLQTELCAECYGKLSVFLKTRKTAADEAWAPPEPEPDPVDDGEIEGAVSK